MTTNELRELAEAVENGASWAEIPDHVTWADLAAATALNQEKDENNA